nr:transposase [Mycobacterium riyadhense]
MNTCREGSSAVVAARTATVLPAPTSPVITPIARWSTYHRDQAAIDAEAALDGIYVLRTPVPATELDPTAVVESYKNLARVERDFRNIKTDDLDLRPIHHRLDERVRAHVLICLLACYLIWHGVLRLRRTSPRVALRRCGL